MSRGLIGWANMIGGQGDLAKSVMKTSSSIAKAETTNLPVTNERDGDKGRLQIVRLILLMIQVRMRW